MIQFDSRGREIPNPIPVEVPIQWRRPPTIQEQIKMFVRRELSQRAAEEGAETFEEADDFDIGDDYDPSSPYEEVFDVSAESEVGPGSNPADGKHAGNVQDVAGNSGSGKAGPQVEGGPNGGAGAVSPANPPGSAPG